MLNLTPNTLYRQQRGIGWTRADMLVALYNATIGHVDAALEALQQEDEQTYRVRQMKASRLVLEIFGGLDLRQGELPARIAQLCEYVQHCLSTRQPGKLQSARQVLVTLREAFETIREEAVALETAGKISRIDQDPKLLVTERA